VTIMISTIICAEENDAWSNQRTIEDRISMIVTVSVI
jgi:hypothetical protein